MQAYLIILATVLIVVGELGFGGVIGPTQFHSPWHGSWYFDMVENIGHTLVGLILFYVAFKETAHVKRTFVLLSSIAGTLAGLYSLLIANKILGANFQNPADTIFHLAIGVSGWLVYYMSPDIAEIKKSHTQ